MMIVVYDDDKSIIDDSRVKSKTLIIEDYMMIDDRW